MTCKLELRIMKARPKQLLQGIPSNTIHVLVRLAKENKRKLERLTVKCFFFPRTSLLFCMRAPFPSEGRLMRTDQIDLKIR